MSKRYDQCDETCTVDCGHCKGAGRPSGGVMSPDTIPDEQFDPGDPITSGDLIEDMEGAPLPHELQYGGRIWQAVRDVLDPWLINLTGQTAEQIEDEELADVTDETLRALAPILWPLLPSNDRARAAWETQHRDENAIEDAAWQATRDEAYAAASVREGIEQRLREQIASELRAACYSQAAWHITGRHSAARGGRKDGGDV